jgi:hypothetical protein
MRSTKYTILFGVIGAIAILLSACSGAPTEGTASYIGTISDAPESARVGIVVENGKFILYICSLDDAFNASLSRWFTGDLDGDGTFAGTSADGVMVNGTVNGNLFTGFITTPQGNRLNMRGSLIPAGGPAGLFRGTGEYEGKPVVIGVVIDEGDKFASATVQVRDSVEFITPIVTPAFRVDNTHLILTVGSLKQKVDLYLVETLE